MKRKQQKVQEFLDSLKVGDRVITTGGIHGQITRLGDLSVQLQIADKVRVEVARAAIGGYQGQEPVVEPLAGAAERPRQRQVCHEHLRWKLITDRRRPRRVRGGRRLPDRGGALRHPARLAS